MWKLFESETITFRDKHSKNFHSNQKQINNTMSGWVQVFSTEFCDKREAHTERTQNTFHCCAHFYHFVIFLWISFLFVLFVRLFKLKCPFIWKYVNYVAMSLKITRFSDRRHGGTISLAMATATAHSFYQNITSHHFHYCYYNIYIIINIVSSKRVIHYICFNHHFTDYVRSYYVWFVKGNAARCLHSAKLIATIPTISLSRNFAQHCNICTHTDELPCHVQCIQKYSKSDASKSLSKPCAHMEIMSFFLLTWLVSSNRMGSSTAAVLMKRKWRNTK